MARQPSAIVRDLTMKAFCVAISLVVLLVAVTGLVASVAGGVRHPDLVMQTLLSTSMLTGHGREQEVWLFSLAGLNVGFAIFVAVIAWIGTSPEWRHTREGPKEILWRLGLAWIGVNVLLEVAHVAMGWITTLSVAFGAQGGQSTPSSATKWQLVMTTMAGAGVLIDVVYLAIIAFGLGVLLAHLVVSWTAPIRATERTPM